MMRVLVVEDHSNLSAQLSAALTQARFAVDRAADGEEALFLGQTEAYDAVVLDLGLPQLDGLSVLRQWRRENLIVPVLILTARDSWTEKVTGLNAGADDYLAKPFAMDELLARLHALIRRAAGRARSDIIVGALALDAAAGTVSWHGAPVRLTGLEFRTLTYLAQHAGRLISKTELTEHLYAQDFDRDSNTVEVVIGRIRRKLDAEFIETVRGQGYKISHG
jgi:two-component system OmpR family response regulator